MGSTVSHKPMSKIQHFVSWFEIPVYDIHRAAAFYNAIYGIEMEVSVNGDFAMAYFPAHHGIGGALIAGPGCFPSDIGSLIYLNAGSDLDAVLGKVELAGGRVIMPKSLISEAAGYFALFIDSEGNRLALHEGADGAKRAVKSASTAAKKKAAGASKAAPRKAAAKKAAPRKRA